MANLFIMPQEKLIQFLLSAGLFARPRAEQIAVHFAELAIPLHCSLSYFSHLASIQKLLKTHG